jgi:hypothetical protein
MTSARDDIRVASLTAGLAATVGAWIFIAAFAPSAVDALGGYSPWIYGPASTAVWALFSGAAYLALRRNRGQGAASDVAASYRCREFTGALRMPADSVCASREEKLRLAAVTAGFALTISSWVAVLSFIPASLLDSLEAAPAWLYCLVSVGLWATLSTLMHAALRESYRPTHQSNHDPV